MLSKLMAWRNEARQKAARQKMAWLRDMTRAPFSWSRLRGPLLVGVLLIVLTGLFRQTQVHNINQHYQIVEQLRALERSHLAIKADALKSHFSIFHNYDAITADSAALMGQISALEESLSQLPTSHDALQAKLSDITTQADIKAVQIEDFKAENAILKNSTTYFPMAVETTLAQLSQGAADSDALAASLKRLSQLVLLHCLDSALADPAEIQRAMAQLATPPITDNVLRHVQAILRLQGDVNQFITVLSNDSLGVAISDLSSAYVDYHRQVTQTKNTYRLLLFIAAVSLVVYSSYLAWSQQNYRMLQAVNHRLSDAVNEKTQALKDAIAQLKRSQAQLVQAEKLSGLGQLSAGIAHEINNPISFIHGNISASTAYSQDCLALIELYEKHYPHPTQEICDFAETIDLEFLKQDWQKLTSSMQNGTQRVKKIVESLRNFSRLDEAQYKQVNLHEGLDSSLLLLNHRLTDSKTAPPIQITKHYGDLPLVLCHASAINQVFISLIGNAIDALREHDSAMQTAPNIVLETYAENARAVIKITDNGKGISQANQNRVFDPFFTTKPVGKGTGLGLTTSYQTIVEAHHGSITVTSFPYEFTTFQIELPIGDRRSYRQHTFRIS